MGSPAKTADELFSPFTKLSPIIYIRDKPDPNPDPQTQTPTICLLFWMDAAPRIAIKFAQEYITRFPTSRIICMFTLARDLLLKTNQKAQSTRVAPFVNALTKPSGEPLHVHAFSNGGTFTLHHIALGFRKITDQPLPIKSFIIDSAPGRTSLATSARAFSMAVPKFFIFRILGVCAVWAVLTAMYVYAKLRRLPDPMELARGTLNDLKFIGGGGERCYIYSERDELIRSRDVEDHAKQAKAKGWLVSLEKFDAPHVAHMRVDPERYWGVVWGVMKVKSG
ncbi:hypothetical protein FQN53_002167 [Emmonsiellopsis sp. PD_33]|nr:hypothetical protein FQN53_002167 [Emmonsiellopsis sp. PD_33]